MYYSQFEACKVLGIAYTTLRRWVKKYQIEYRLSVAGKVRLSEESVDILRTIRSVKQIKTRGQLRKK